MDIFTAHYNGLPLTWISQNAPHAPDYGEGWLRLFNGGLLVTCGYTHVGPPEVDTQSGEQRDIHGNATRLRATDVGVTVDEDTLTIRGVMSENRLFGEQLQIERTYRLKVGVPTITLEDKITNRGDMPCPLMVLYHFNVGYPLVREGTQLFAASKVMARDAAAEKGIGDWANYHAPSVGYAEQVFYHHSKVNEKTAQIVLANDDLAVELAWDTTHCPYFTQWKNTRRGIYVSGIEPGNCVPEGQNRARETGRLIMLKPDETHTFRNTLSFAHQATDIAAMKARVQALGETGAWAEGFAIG
jgi:galactose mutarotase-like enzyme